MNMKTLLGTAAGLMVATGAYAADLPGDAAPAAVDYVKVCDAVGAGYFYIPGSETCLKLSGRVRAKVKYESDQKVSDAKSAYATYTTADGVVHRFEAATAAAAVTAANAYRTAYIAAYGAAAAPNAALVAADGVDPVAAVYGDKVSFAVDGRVQFSAVTASDLGNIESFFEIKDDGGIKLGDAYISVGYLKVGAFGDVPNGDVFYGDKGFVVSGHDVDLFDNGNLTAQIMASDLGGGFYAGMSVSTLGSGDSDVLAWSNNGTDDGLDYAAAVGIKGQSWGSAEVAFSYEDREAYYVYGVQAKADLKLIDKVDMRLVAAYANFEKADDFTTLAAAVKFAATDSLSVFAGVKNDFYSGATKDQFGAQFGATYAIAPGLELLGEVNYLEDAAKGGTEDSWGGLIKLTRNW